MGPGRVLRGQVLFPLFLLAIAVVIFVASFYLPEGAMQRTSPALYPRIVALALGMSAAWSLISEFRAVEPSKVTDLLDSLDLPSVEVDPAPPATHFFARHPLATTIAASVLYPVVMQIVGYLVSTVLYTFLLSFVLRTKTTRGILGSVGIAIGLVAVTYAAFVWGLDANLPEGRFE